MTIFSCLRQPSWILATILGKRMPQKYSHNSSIIPKHFKLSNCNIKKVLTPSTYPKLSFVDSLMLIFYLLSYTDRVPPPLMTSRDVQSVLCGGSDAAPDMNVDGDPDVNCSYCSICQVPTEDNEASSCEVCAKNVCHKCSFVHSLGSCSGAPPMNCFPSTSSSVELESQKVVHEDERPYRCTV